MRWKSEGRGGGEEARENADEADLAEDVGTGGIRRGSDTAGDEVMIKVHLQVNGGRDN